MVEVCKKGGPRATLPVTCQRAGGELTILTLLTTLALLPTLSLSALALRSLLLLLSTRPRAWAFGPRTSGITAAAISVSRLLLRLRLSALLRSRLLPRLWAARLHIGALFARS